MVTPLIKYRYFIEDNGGTQLFLFRTFAMLCSLVMLFLISALFKAVFSIPGLIKYDVFQCYEDSESNAIVAKAMYSGKSGIGNPGLNEFNLARGRGMAELGGKQS